MNCSSHASVSLFVAKLRHKVTVEICISLFHLQVFITLLFIITKKDSSYLLLLKVTNRYDWIVGVCYFVSELNLRAGQHYTKIKRFDIVFFISMHFLNVSCCLCYLIEIFDAIL